MALSADSARLGATTNRILNKQAFAVANDASDITTATTSDVIQIFDADADYAAKYGDGANILEMMGVTATAAEINQAADDSANVETVTTTNVIAATESGKTFFLSLAGGFTSTLPAPAVGLRFKFIVKTAPTTSYVIVTNGGANIMIGGINELEVDTADDGPYDNDADTLNLVANIAAVGDWVEFISDGTSWYFTGQTNLDGGVTTSTT